MGASMVAKGIFHVHLGELPGGFLLENLGYTFGFVIVIMARQQLFTENTVTAVLPIMHKPTPGILASCYGSGAWCSSVTWSVRQLRPGPLI
jgi:formate/nitrite transporter FocA (FNT family)